MDQEVDELMDLKQLRGQLGKLGAQVSRECTAATQKAGRWALAEAKARTKAVTPKIDASSAYSKSWNLVKTQDGAVVYNSAPHAKFVERGRRPGRMPPVGRIAIWLLQKKMVRIKAPKPRLNKSGFASLSEPRVQRARAKQSRNFNRKVRAAWSMAFAIAKAIARRGIKPRPILASVVADVGPVIDLLVAKAMAKVMEGPKRIRSRT